MYEVLQDRYVQSAMERLSLSKVVLEEFPEEVTFEFCFGEWIGFYQAEGKSCCFPLSPIARDILSDGVSFKRGKYGK